MTLPRFTSGKVGNLEFSHLNDVFEFVDSMRRGSGQAGPARPGIDSLVLAQLGVRGIDNRYAWYEVTIGLTGAVSVVQGGLSSGAPAPQTNPDPYLLPAVSVDGTAFAVGDVVLLAPARHTNGIAYMVIVRPVGSTVAPYEIVGATGISSGRWSYIGRRRRWDAVNLAWIADGSQEDVSMLNGAENVVDSTGVIGVGSTLPGSAPQPVRQRIKNGTIVTPTNTGGMMVFCVPNGYAFQCP